MFEPAKKIYVATMEEGVYEVDMVTLEVNELFADSQDQVPGGKPAAPIESRPLANLPGYHGKGLYSGQGRLIYANNGEPDVSAMKQPDVRPGCLAEWDGRSNTWSIVRRNQFTDIRGPGGIFGNQNPETDPIWAIGWDHRSLILMLLDHGNWHAYRLPKASHCYDGAHGWNTEWPRFQDIGEEDFVMNMHGMFWRFPRTFSLENSAGIAPRSTYLKVIGDFCRWEDQLVFGCDDTARSEFLNKRKAKGSIAGPGQSHSCLWFANPSILDKLGPKSARGALWIEDDVSKDVPSDPFLFSGFSQRSIHLVNHDNMPVAFTIEVDREGANRWESLTVADVEAGGATWLPFDKEEVGVWLRIRASRDCRATAHLSFSDDSEPQGDSDKLLQGIASTTSKSVSSGLVRVRGENLKTLAFAATTSDGETTSKPAFYELDGDLVLKLVENPTALQWTLDHTSIPEGVITVDKASVLYVDDGGKRWRLPKTSPEFDSQAPWGPDRLVREVVTERDLFNCHGTFYELPAANAGGFSRIRPICTHNRRIRDFCSYRGLLILTGVDSDGANSEHIIRSLDGQVALWAGVIDDLWKFGTPVGTGGPWKETRVKANETSDPYLMTGYNRKSLQISHSSDFPVSIRAEVDITGNGTWITWKSFSVGPGETVEYQFPSGFGAYWIRFAPDRDTNATAILTYD